MWKCLVILVFVQRVIVSQPVNEENIRETRHLNYEECCPCPTSDGNGIRERAQDSWASEVPRDCPCQRSSDSDTASSILRPAMRAVEPFNRPRDTTEPKPLLKPEVGLASSVLETLREVTDQEYQEALARDAARSAISDLESNTSEQNAPRSIVNIILKPKHDHMNDVIPEASHVQEVRCIQHPLGKSNGIDESSVQSFRNTLLPLSKVPRNNLIHKRIFDMDNSASSTQEQIIQPLRSNLLEDLKFKSELLKTKLFPGIGNSLGVTKPLNMESGKSQNFRVPSLLDRIKISKENNLLTVPSTSDMEKQRESDVMSSPSNSERYSYTTSNHFRSNPQPSLSKVNNKFDTQANNLNNKINKVSQQRDSTLLYSTNDKSDIRDNSKLSRNSEYNENNSIENNDFSNDDHDQILDAASNPSDISEIKLLGTSDMPQNNQNEECDQVNDENTNIDTNSLGDNIKHTEIEEVVPSSGNELICDEKSDLEELNTINSMGDTDNMNIQDENLCVVKDVDTSAISNIPHTTTLQESNQNSDAQIGNIKDAKTANELNFNEQQSNHDILAKSAENDDNRRLNSLPHIKGNILKTLESFKKTNERIQEKLKSNVQDALQSMVAKKNPSDVMESSQNIDDPIEADINKRKNIQTLDLQEMSNQILNLSNMKEDEKLRHASNSKEYQPSDLKYEDNNEQSNNDYVRVSALNDTPRNLIDDSISSNSIEKQAGENKLEHDNQEELQDRDRLQKIEIEPKVLDNTCVNIPKSSNGMESDSDLDQNEMMSQASSPVISSTRHIVQPKNFKVKNVFDNLKNSITDVFDGQRDSKLASSISDNENDNTMINAIYGRNGHVSETYSPRTNKERLDLGPTVKNANNNLSSYRAKIAVPASLNRASYKESSKDYPFKNLRSQTDSRPVNLKSLVENADNHKNILRSKSQVFNTHRNAPLSIDDFKPHNVLKNVQGVFDSPFKKTLFRNNNNVISKASPSEVFGTIAQTNSELNEKLRAFHSDLNERFTSFSQKISDIRPLQLKGEPRYKNIKSSSNLKHTKLPAIKSNRVALQGRKDSLKLNTAQSPSKIIDIRNRKPVQKLKSPTEFVSESKNSPTISRPSKLKDDVTKRKGIKLKSLKDNKVTITFTTTMRPNLSSKRNNPSISQSSKLSEIKLKSISNEPRTSASESIASRVPLSDRRSRKEKEMSINDKNASIYDKSHLYDKSSSNSEEIDINKMASPLLSKIRNAVKVRNNGNVKNSKKIDDYNNALTSEADGELSASNLNDVTLKDKPLKENVSYKCKMMCFEDHDDA